VRIKILGSSGFIGSRLSRSLTNQGHQIFLCSRKQELKCQNTSDWVEHSGNEFEEPRVVINLVGAWRNCSQNEVVDANYSYPAKILREEGELQGPLLWIQASSYFQLYKKFYGVDKDLYSKSKQNFSELLKLDSNKSSKLSVIDIFLPHIIGAGEPTERIFPLLAKALLQRQTLDLGSGSAIMPLLDVEDISNDISKLLSDYHETNYGNYTETYPTVSRISSLRSHIESLLQEPSETCRYDSTKDREKEFLDSEVLKLYYQVNPARKSFSKSFSEQITNLRELERNS
jgi:nucleoside-diphosphate-sugar epimerase